jgi:betaine lipid synthase
MASAGGNILPPDISPKHLLAGVTGVAFFAAGLLQLYTKPSSIQNSDDGPGLLKSLLLFCYSCFIKPHNATGNGSQQDHLESFYATQATIYDRTRKALLHGREDMLALVGAQLQFKGRNSLKGDAKRKRIWVDVGFILVNAICHSVTHITP